jgi:hypothetical protein
METPSAEDAGKALAGAQRFLAKESAPLELLRLEVLLGERSGSALEQALAPLFGAQSGDACVALEVLEALADAGCLRVGLADRVAESLRASQSPDGSWHAGGRAAPPATKPARPAVGARDALFLTAMLGAYLGRTARSSAATLRAAGGYVAVHWSPELVQAGSWYAISGYAHFFSNVPHEISDAVLQWCGRELERAYRTGAFDAVRAARVFTLCDAHALPGAKVDAVELVPALLRAQSADGGWPAPTIPLRITNTLWAALALVKLRPRSPRGAAW